jgi:hypothetical protein
LQLSIQPDDKPVATSIASPAGNLMPCCDRDCISAPEITRKLTRTFEDSIITSSSEWDKVLLRIEYSLPCFLTVLATIDATGFASRLASIIAGAKQTQDISHIISDVN